MPQFSPRVISRTLVKAALPPADFPPVTKVSNLDLLIHSFSIFAITVYPASSGVRFSDVIAAVAGALPTFLNTFFPFAGRLDFSSSHEIFIRNNNAGAELVVAKAGVPLSEVDFSDGSASLGSIQIPFDSELPLSLQLVSFECGGYSLTWGSNHLLVDGHGFRVLTSSWSELLRTGSISCQPNHDRSLFVPRSPPQYDSSLDHEFAEHNPDEGLVNALLVDTLVRRLYFVESADVERIRSSAENGDGRRRISKVAAVSAYIWKMLAAATDGLDERCRMAWIIDGRRCLRDKYGGATLNAYLGNVLSYVTGEAAVSELKSMPLSGVASLVREAILEVSTEERFQQLVDWMEVKRKPGVKWTERVGIGLGSPAMVMSAVLPEPYDCDFGFGPPAMTMAWLRPGRLGSSSIIVVASSANDGSWIVSARLWPRLAAALEADHVFKRLTAAKLGLLAPQAPAARPPAGRL